ncbi:MAG TPA: hypothetical protein VHB45_12875 [Alloacidobacterium sp.]|nr:hypothetical protein [Alloacidobacterium sp.]
MSEPTATSSPFYTFLYKFLKTLAGDLKSRFGQYIPLDNAASTASATATKTLSLFVLCAALSLSVAGCAHQVNAPLPKGAINSIDAQTNAVLQAGHAAAAQYEADVKAGFVPSGTLKAAVAQLVNALNVADPLYQTWHSVLQSDPGAAQPAQLASSVSQVSSSLATITSAAK